MLDALKNTTLRKFGIASAFMLVGTMATNQAWAGGIEPDPEPERETLTCDQLPVSDELNARDEFGLNLQAGERVNINFSGPDADRFALGYINTEEIICDGAACSPATFVAPETDTHEFVILRSEEEAPAAPDGKATPAADILGVTVTLTCGLSADDTVDGIDKVMKLAYSSTTMDASSLASAALNGNLGLAADMVRVDTRSNEEKAFDAAQGGNRMESQLTLMGKVDDDEFGIGFEHKLGAMSSRAGETGDAIIGNARYYDFNGFVSGDAWQGQIGFRHDLGNGRKATIYGSYRNSDVKAKRAGLSIDEDSYGVGALWSGPVGDKGLTASATVHYERGEADIEVNNATGEADTYRLSGAVAIKGDREYKNFNLAPRLVGGLVRFDRDSYTDSAATTVDGSNETEHFLEAGLRITPLTVEDGKLDWYLDASADYASETLDGVVDLSGRTIDDRSVAGNVEGGLTFALNNGSTLILSAGGRGLGRESRAVFGNALLRVPFNH